jgi:hypothetical protein
MTTLRLIQGQGTRMKGERLIEAYVAAVRERKRLVSLATAGDLGLAEDVGNLAKAALAAETAALKRLNGGQLGEARRRLVALESA